MLNDSNDNKTATEDVAKNTNPFERRVRKEYINKILEQIDKIVDML